MAGSGTPLSILFQILGIDEAKSKLASISPELSKIQALAKGVSTDANAMSTNLGKIGQGSTGITTATTNLQKLDTQEKTTAATATLLATNQEKVNTAAQQTGTSTNTAAGGIQKLDTTQKSASTSAGQLSGEQDKIKTSSSGVATGANTVTGAMDKQSSSMEKGAESTKKVDEGHKTLQGSMTALGGSTVSLVGSTVSLWESYDSLGDAQLRVDKAANTLQATRLKETALQNQLNKLLADGKEGTDQYALVEDKLQLAHEKVTAAEGTLQNAQEDLNTTQIDFYKEILPQIVTMLGSVTSVMGNMGGVIGKFKEGLGNLSIESIKTSNAFKLISLSNPFFIALTVGGAIVGAFVSNLFGFRDAINGVGVALGNALPFMKPFLTIVGDLGKGLAQLFGQGGEQAKAYGEDVSTGFNTAATGAETGTTAVKGHIAGLNQPIQSADQLIAGFANDSSKNWNTAGAATKAFPEQLKGSLTEAQQAMLNMVADAELTVQKMQEVFSKSIKVGNLDITGFDPAIQGANITVQTLDQTFGKLGPHMEEIKGQTDGLSKAFQFFNSVHAITDASTGKLIVNLDELQAAFKKGGITLSEQSAILDMLSNKMGVQFVSAIDKDVNGTNNLAKSSGDLKTQLAAQMQQQQQNVATTGQHSNANQALQGTTVGVDNALGQQDNTLQSLNTSGTQAVKMYADLDKTATDLDKSLQANYDTLNTTDGMIKLYNNSIGEAVKKQQEDTIAVIQGAVAAEEFSKSLNTTQGQALSFTQGVVAMQEELNKTKDSITNNQGQLVQLNSAMATGKAQSDAFAASFTAQQLEAQKATLAISDAQGKTAALTVEYINGQSAMTVYNTALEDQKQKMLNDSIETEKLKATFEVLHAQMATGIPQITAATTGFYNQKTALEEDMLAIDNTKGSLVALNQDMQSGQAQTVAFNKGFFDQVLVFNKATIAISSEKGEISALTQELLSGNSLVQAFQKGQEDMTKKIIESVTAISNQTGALDAQNRALNSGLAQTIAYADGQQKTALALDALITANSSAVGSINELYKELQNGSMAASQFTSGLDDGITSVLNWAGAMEKSKGEAEGWVEGFQIVSGVLGTKLPEGFKYSEESAKSFIEITQGIPSALDKAAQSADAAGHAFTDSLVQAFRKGGKDLDAELKKLSEDTGVKFTKQMKDALKPGLITSSLQDYLTHEFGALKAMDFGSAGFDQMVNAMAGKITELVQKNPQLAQAGNYILELLTHPQNSAQWWGQLQNSINGLGSSLDLAGTSASTLNQGLSNTSGYQQQVSAIKPLSDALAAMGLSGKAAVDYLVSIGVPAAQAAQVLQQVGAGATAAGTAANTASPQMQAFYSTIAGFGTLETLTQSVFQTGIPGAISAATPALSAAINQYMNGGMATFVQVLNTLGPATAQSVEQANAAFSTLNPVQPTLATGMQQIGTILQTFAPAITQIVNDSNTAFGTLNPVQPTFTAGMTGLGSVLASLSPAIAQVVNESNTVFATLDPVPESVVSKLGQFSEVLKILPFAVALVIGQANNVFATLDPVPTVVSDKLGQFADVLKILPSAVALVVGQANTAFTALNPVPASVGQKLSTFGTVLQAIPQAVAQVITTANISFSQLGVTIEAPLAKIQTDTQNATSALIPIVQGNVNRIPPIFVNAISQIATAEGKLSSDASNAFNAIINVANSIIPRIPPIFSNAVNSIVNSLNTLPTTASRNFGTVSTQSQTAANNVAKQLPAAFTTVISAANSMSSRVSGSFLNIASSAQTATNAVRSLQGQIDALHGKTVDIVTRHIDTYSGGGAGAASGYGPTIVNHPVNLTVGESGPEYVQVTPLKSSAGGGHMSAGERLNTYSDPGNVGSNSIKMANGTITNNNTSNNNNNGVSNFYSTSSSPPPNPISDNKNNSSFDLRGLAVLGSQINQMVQSILQKAFSNTAINIQTVNNVDGRKVYESQQRYFNQRSGALLK